VQKHLHCSKLEKVEAFFCLVECLLAATYSSLLAKSYHAFVGVLLNRAKMQTMLQTHD